MAELNLYSALVKQNELSSTSEGELWIPKGFVTPGFISVATCLGFKVDASNLIYEDPLKHSGLFDAFKVPYILTGQDAYCYDRQNAGINYSPMQMLENSEDVDRSTSETSNCIRRYAGTNDGINKLCQVIGELHDNVRAHAGGAGFSMSLKWDYMGRTPVIEFSVADCGQGFLRECNRINVPEVIDDSTAIEWCLGFQNSTKDRDYDEFTQTQPLDAMGNPFGENVDTRIWNDGNNHQGLGLAKLMELINLYEGQMWVGSGSSVLVSNKHTRSDESIGSFHRVPHWQGVAIACRLSLCELGKHVEEEPLPDDVQDVMNFITN